ncbi:MAG: hypothetical protein EXS35_14030 [Pedosphaera sp.]|nr:hypothetical protein [Pedosphaera sp.]
MNARLLLRTLAVALLVQLVASCATSRSAPDAAAVRRQALIGTRATYCRAPRKPDQRVDVDKLIAELVELRANTYSFCIHGWATDWDDLKLILPAANAKGIRVWASIVPPSESYPKTKMYAEPFRLDYVRWAKEFAKLSLQHTNLVAWSIDDFTHNLKQTYTPAYLKQMLDGARAINPQLAFVPCCYFPAFNNAAFTTNYVPLLDGILFPYRHESGGANLTNASLTGAEIKKIKALVGEKIPIILDIYATAHSRLGATTPAYVEEAMRAGHRAADGVMIYCHQDPKTDAAKFAIMKRNFHACADEAPRAERRKNLRGTFGTYDNEPRLINHRVDVKRLANELATIKANTYNFLIWHTTNDWDDLKLFLPLARARGIKVWVTLVPPTEPPASAPFAYDFARWAVELAQLSLREPNLVAWSLDDFSDNVSDGRFKPEDWEKILAGARAINPKLAFVPCLYFQHLTPAQAAGFAPLVDGVLFPYMHAAGKMNLTDTDTVEAEVARFKELFGAEMPVLVDVYATHHSALNETTPEYVEKVMTLARGCADGVLIYCHQYEGSSPGKYRVIKKLFGEWSPTK